MPGIGFNQMAGIIRGENNVLFSFLENSLKILFEESLISNRAVLNPDH
jgi:hypothetical protein